MPPPIDAITAPLKEQAIGDLCHNGYTESRLLVVGLTKFTY